MAFVFEGRLEIAKKQGEINEIVWYSTYTKVGKLLLDQVPKSSYDKPLAFAVCRLKFAAPWKSNLQRSLRAVPSYRNALRPTSQSLLSLADPMWANPRLSIFWSETVNSQKSLLSQARPKLWITLKWTILGIWLIYQATALLRSRKQPERLGPRWWKIIFWNAKTYPVFLYW